MLKKRFHITDYLEVVLTEDDKTEIYVKGECFIQCSHVLTTIHTDEIDNLLLLESVDEIKESFPTIVIDPETRYFVHCSNLQAWVENNFDSRMLHSNLSFPLLKKLVEEGCVNSIILKEEIAKRFEGISSKMIRFLFEHGYLNSLSKEELSVIIAPNLKFLLEDLLTGIDDDRQLLSRLLERSLNEELIAIIKEKLSQELENGDLWLFSFLADYGHLDSLFLSKEDLSTIIPSNFQSLLIEVLEGRERDLQLRNYLLESSLNEDLKTRVKEELAKILEKGNLDTLYFLYRRGFLKYISDEKLSEIVTPKFKRLLERVFRDRSDRGEIGYLLERNINEDFKTTFKKEIAKIFKTGDSREIDYSISHGFLDFLSKEELSAIVIPNLSEIVKMNVDFKNYILSLDKDDLSKALTRDVLRNAPINILKSLPFEFKTLLKELLRRLADLRYFDFDKLVSYLMNKYNHPYDPKEAKIIIAMIKEEVTKILKKNPSTKFLNSLISQNSWGYFRFLDYKELSAVPTPDILHNAPIKLFLHLPFEYKATIKELLRRYDVGNDAEKNEVREYFDFFKPDDKTDPIFYDLLTILFNQYENADDAKKKEIIIFFDAIIDARRDQLVNGDDDDEFIRMLGSNTLKGMLKTLSIRDLLHLRYHRKKIDLQYKEEVTRRFRLRNSDLRNLDDLRIDATDIGEIIDWSDGWGEDLYTKPQMYDIMYPFSKLELLLMLPKKFIKIENIITKLNLNFKIDDIDHYSYENDYDDEFLNLLIFSVNNTEDLAKITIQNYPDLSNNLDWIFSELGNIKDVQYIIELWNNDISALPTSIPNARIIELIIDNKTIKS